MTTLAIIFALLAIVFMLVDAFIQTGPAVKWSSLAWACAFVAFFFGSVRLV